MKIGVLSDTHLDRVTKELHWIYEQHLADLDVILHAGDYISHEVIRFLGKGRFHGVRGNMDPIGLSELVPDKKVIELGPYRVGLIHGWGAREDLSYRVQKEFQDVDIIVFGHAHKPMNEIRDGILFFNPGAATGHHRSYANTIGILELGDTIHGEIVQVGD